MTEVQICFHLNLSKNRFNPKVFTVKLFSSQHAILKVLQQFFQRQEYRMSSVLRSQHKYLMKHALYFPKYFTLHSSMIEDRLVIHFKLLNKQLVLQKILRFKLSFSLFIYVTHSINENIFVKEKRPIFSNNQVELE